MERFGEQAKTRKKVEGHSLKFIHGNWNSKSGSSTYLHFKVNFERLSEINFVQAIYYFEAQEIRSPTLQMVYKSELKQRSYGHLKAIA